MRARRVMQAKLPRTQVNMYPVTALAPKASWPSGVCFDAFPLASFPLVLAREGQAGLLLFRQGDCG